jgi:sugar/nucleoside kinase (ribokinase family)
VFDGWSYKAMGPEVNEAAIEVANDADVPVFFDPGPEILNIPRSWTKAIISSSKVALLTYEEAEHLTQIKATPDEMTRVISDMGPDIVLIKLGTGTRLPQRNEIIEMLSAEKHPITDDPKAND